MEKNYKISIITPIYNSEQYLKNCLISLFEQQFDSIEYIFIDDCSTDHSANILFSTIIKYPHLKPHIKYIKNIQNYGSGYSRKRGIMNACGEYTIQIDSDDWIDKNMCNMLYNKAYKDNADIVICDFYESFPSNEIYRKQNYQPTVAQNFQGILVGKIHGSLCNKLIKRSLYINNNIYPPEDFSLFEDKYTMLRLLLKTDKISYLNQAFLHYRQHNNSMTIQVKDKHITDNIRFISYLSHLFEVENLMDLYKNDFYSCILYHKKLFLLNQNYYIYWDTICPEANKIKYVFKLDVYDWKKKLITILSILISKKIMLYAYSFYKRNKNI